MKKQYFLCLLVILGIGSRATAQQAFLDVGSTVDIYPKVEWLKGEQVTKLEKDKIYIVELWATWCVPCIAAMPHLNDLNNKFKDKNVIFIAQDVLEYNLNRVHQFIAQKGDALGYRIAYSGPKGSDFEVNWVEAAGVTSIPQTFVIQNNKLVWQTTPDMLNEQVLQLLVDGKFSIEAAKATRKKN